MLFAQFYVPANLIYYYNLRFVEANQSVFESELPGLCRQAIGWYQSKSPKYSE